MPKGSSLKWKQKNVQKYFYLAFGREPLKTFVHAWSSCAACHILECWNFQFWIAFLCVVTDSSASLASHCWYVLYTSSGYRWSYETFHVLWALLLLLQRSYRISRSSIAEGDPRRLISLTTSWGYSARPPGIRTLPGGKGYDPSERPLNFIFLCRTMCSPASFSQLLLGELPQLLSRLEVSFLDSSLLLPRIYICCCATLDLLPICSIGQVSYNDFLFSSSWCDLCYHSYVFSDGLPIFWLSHCFSFLLIFYLLIALTFTPKFSGYFFTLSTTSFAKLVLQTFYKLTTMEDVPISFLSVFSSFVFLFSTIGLV